MIERYIYLADSDLRELLDRVNVITDLKAAGEQSEYRLQTVLHDGTLFAAILERQ